MPRNSGASVYGGAGGRGVRASVSNLSALRNVLRNKNKNNNNTEPDSDPLTASAPTTAAEHKAAPSKVPDDNKQELQGLNNRLKSYLDRVKELKEENGKLQKEIDDIMEKRKTPKERDWDKLQEPLEEQEKKIKELTMDNAKLLLQIDNNKLTEEDFNYKLKDEIKIKKELEKDISILKKDSDETKQSRDQLQEETNMVKEDVKRLKEDHKDLVNNLHEKIKNSEVKVEIESQNNNLEEIVQKMRVNYENQAKKNLKEAEEWYKTKFENIQVKQAQDSEALASGMADLKELEKQKKSLEMQIQASHNMLTGLEDALWRVNAENNGRLSPLNDIIRKLEDELKELRTQVEQKVQKNRELLCLKMKLEKEIEEYNNLIRIITADAETMEFNIQEAFQMEQSPKVQQREPVQEAIVDRPREGAQEKI